MKKRLISFWLPMLLLATAGCGEGGDADRQRASATADGEAAIAAEAGPEPVERGASDEAPAAEPAAEAVLGPALSDPERYYGLFAAPGRPGRPWFVAEARNPAWAERAPPVPPGHLMLGAMFGDVAPWHLKTLTETDFVQVRVGPGAQEAIEIEFRLDPDGRAEALRFSGGALADDTWLVRAGDLPEDW